MKKATIKLGLISVLALSVVGTSMVFAYDGNVDQDVKRDRIIAISEDFASLYYEIDATNVDDAAFSGATVPDTVVGWKTSVKYCWGGEDSTKIYLDRLTAGALAGNKDTSGSSTTDTHCTGADCSGFSSNTWTSARRSTAGIPGISDDIDWEDLRMGDCTNKAGSHVRVFDYYVTNSGQLMYYESTSGSGIFWANVHRALARDNDYIPVRYNSTYKVVDYAEPMISYVKRNGLERVSLRWDGQADTGFRLYTSENGVDNWQLIRDEATLTPPTRVCEVSGLVPNKVHYFQMTSVNSAGETIPSAVVPVCLDGQAPRVLLVDGADRLRQTLGESHTILNKVGHGLGSTGLGFDYTANEAVVDNQTSLVQYESVIWILAEEATFDESFSWPEQNKLTDYLDQGGNLFASGSEVAWDLVEKADSTTYKNGHPNDASFYSDQLLSTYVDDSAATYAAQGAVGTLFDSLSLSFDDGTHGTYDVDYPDVMAANGSTAILEYDGGIGGTAAIMGTHTGGGKVFNMGFGIETIYPQEDLDTVTQLILGDQELTASAPTLKSVCELGSGEVEITWEGHASQGFRLYHKLNNGSWTQLQDETTLTSEVRSATLPALTEGDTASYKVTAVNTAGESGESDVLATCKGVTNAPKVLVVDGYDRWNKDNPATPNPFVEKICDSLKRNNACYDSCTNEQIVSGNIDLNDYLAVFWLSGEESTESETFSHSEQQLVQAYLENDGALFVSGSEIGWDLVEKADTLNDYSNGSANDTPFFQDYLKATYVQDDANSYSATGVAGSIFEGISLTFDDGTNGTYNVAYPDVLGISGGSSSAMTYGAGSDIAAVTYKGSFGSTKLTGESAVIFIGFPLETIVVPADLDAIVNNVLGFFDYSNSDPTKVNDWKAL
jgi:hypothetical protein